MSEDYQRGCENFILIFCFGSQSQVTLGQFVNQIYILVAQVIITDIFFFFLSFFLSFFFLFLFLFFLTGHYVTETVTYSLYVVMSKISMYF